MGNSPGDLEDYFQMIEANDGMCGGFIWEWCDHGIYKGKAENGKNMYWYGGDHGEYPNDGNFCMDGMVYPDRTPHTGLLEYKNVYRPARVISYNQSSGELVLHNYLDFTDLKDYLFINWEVNCDGNITSVGRIEVPSIPAHGNGTLFLRIDVPATGKCYLKLSYHLKKETAFVPAHHLLGYEEVLLKNDDGKNQKATALLAQKPDTAPAVKVSESEFALTILSNRLSYTYNKRKGLFDRLVCDGETLIDRPMELNIWRAPTDNERKLKLDWFAAHYDKSITRAYETNYEVNNNEVHIHTVMSMVAIVVQKFMDIETDWTVFADGTISVSMNVKRNLEFPELPRFGLRLFLPKEMENVTYYGYGPYESYVDKHNASTHGVYSSAVSQMQEDYIRPQENGSHFDCDYVVVKGIKKCLAAVSDKPFCFNASVFTEEELTEKTHNYELVPCGSTVLCLDYKQNGIGSESCGPRLLKKYRLDDGEFTFTMKLIPSIE
jgi:beta-galactosidase